MKLRAGNVEEDFAQFCLCQLALCCNELSTIGVGAIKYSPLFAIYFHPVVLVFKYKLIIE